ncbi:MAG TPA: glycosyltransferase [Edaphobacter sp.]|nr:glycosyltransferase [Edaphobacter sp.]
MRVLLLHNRYQIQGGEDVVVAQEAEMLRSFGILVDVFEITNDSISTVQDKIYTTVHLAYSSRMREQVRERIRSFRADVVHVHNSFPRFTPSVYHAANIEGCGVVQTLHNYRLMCANGYLFREQKICTDCLTQGSAWPALVHRCYRGSAVGTAALTGMVAYHKIRRTWRNRIGRFITLTAFARSLFIEYVGLPADRVIVKANVVPDIGVTPGDKKYALFVGRLSPEKGIGSILRAARSGMFPLPLMIVGSGPMENEVRAAAELGQLEFLGKRSSEEVHLLLQRAKMLLAPSMWHEGGVPLVIGEAFSAGVPVITSRIKPIDSVVEHERNGLLVTPGSEQEICEAAARFHSDRELLGRMRIEARQTYEQLYRAANNFRALLDIYTDAIEVAKQPLSAEV